MFSRASYSICILALCSLLDLVNAHTIITYPGWRGDNLHSSGNVTETNGLQPFDTPNGTLYPYGMQWTYPCGGMPITQNRTKWPVKGGAVAFQPGWFQGHGTAYIYINMGFGNFPLNYSNVIYSGLQIVGPWSLAYPGTFCLPQLPLPANHTVQVGDNATIQLIETAVHGAALYNCVDITFAEPEDCEQVTEENCFNSSQISANLIYATKPITAGAESLIGSSRLAALSAILASSFIYAIL